MSAPTPEIIATWPVPDYENPRGIMRQVDAVMYSTTIVMLLFVGSRLFVRVRSKIGMGLDDWFMAVASVSTANARLLRESDKYRSLLA